MNFEKIEAIFFSVLEDIHDYLPDLTLVGGWLPYIYTNFLWKTSVRNPVTTVDIDFGIDQSVTREYSKTIFETLSFLDYKERHLNMDRILQEISLYREEGYLMNVPDNINKFFERVSSQGCQPFRYHRLRAPVTFPVLTHPTPYYQLHVHIGTFFQPLPPYQYLGMGAG